MRRSNKRGVSLIAAIAIMLLVSVLGADMALLLGVSARASVDSFRSAQALGLAEAGLNWYMMRLAGISDWSAEADQSDVSLGPGAFDVTLTNKTSTRVDVAITGKIDGSDGVAVKRTMSQRAWKLPSASKFAVFWGRDTGAWLQLRSGTVINGDMWSMGTTEVMSGCSVTDGAAYRPDTEDVTGSGTFTEVSVTSPYPSMPAITSTYYTNLISTYNALIDANTSATDIDQATNLALTGNTVNCRDFSTDGNITVSGYGFIVANRNIELHSNGSDSGTLTISPSGGNIVFIAARSLTVNSTQSDTAISGSSGIKMYSRSQTGTGQLLRVRNDTTNIDAALLLANRRIIVENSANLTNSTLFVNYQASDTNNYLQVTDSGTSVGAIAGPCSLISISGRDPGLRINNNASVTGLVYHKDAANTGYTQLDEATITGCVIASQFTNDRIVDSAITYNPSAMQDPPPEGFDGFAAKKPDSWSGN